MALRRKMHNRVDLLALQNVTHKAGTHNVSLFFRECHRWLPLQTCSSASSPPPSSCWGLRNNPNNPCSRSCIAGTFSQAESQHGKRWMMSPLCIHKYMNPAPPVMRMFLGVYVTSCSIRMKVLVETQSFLLNGSCCLLFLISFMISNQKIISP